MTLGLLRNIVLLLLVIASTLVAQDVAKALKDVGTVTELSSKNGKTVKSIVELLHLDVSKEVLVDIGELSIEEEVSSSTELVHAINRIGSYSVALVDGVIIKGNVVVDKSAELISASEVFGGLDSSNKE